MFKAKFETDNAAFEDYKAGEVSRILYEIADQIANGETGTFRIRDVNGNTVGEFTLT